MTRVPLKSRTKKLYVQLVSGMMDGIKIMT